MKTTVLMLASVMILQLTLPACGLQKQIEVPAQHNPEYSAADPRVDHHFNEAAPETTAEAKNPAAPAPEGQEAMKMKLKIGDYSFTAALEENAAAQELICLLKTRPITIEMRDYSGFEKVGALGTSLSASNTQTTANAGDIVLYNGNQIVIFYGSNSWSYTRLGKIEDLTNWNTALGSGSVTVTFSLSE